MKKLSCALLSACLSLAMSLPVHAKMDQDADEAPKSVKERLAEIKARSKKAKEPVELDGKAQKNSKIKACVKKFEAHDEQLVSEFIERYFMFDEEDTSTHAAVLKAPELFEYPTREQKFEKAEEIGDRMRRHYKKIIEAHEGRNAQLEAIIKHLGDGEATKAHRKQKMESAQQTKKKLIAENLAAAREGKLSEDKQARLLLEGVVYDPSDKENPLKPTKDKLLELKNGFAPNPANQTAMEAFTMYVHHCRGAQASRITHAVGTGEGLQKKPKSNASHKHGSDELHKELKARTPKKGAKHHSQEEGIGEG